MTLAIAAGVIVCALVAVGLARGRHRHALPLLALRGAAVACVALLAWIPPAPSQSALRAARGVGLVVDGSASMALGDRASRARRLVARVANEGGVTSVWVAGDRGPVASDLESITSRMPADARTSRLLPAIARALATEPPPASLVVITDGELTDDARDVAQLAQCPPVRIARLAARPAPDVALGAARIDPIVFAGTSARVSFRVRGAGLAQAHSVRVTVSDARGVPLGTETVALAAGDSERAATITVPITEPGAQRVRIVAREPDGDALPGNATVDLALRALRDRLRVLLLAGRPSLDLRALRLALRAHRNLDLVSFYILRTDDDLSMAPNEELALIPFPTDELFREHLQSFDAVFIHDLDPAPYGLETYLPRLVQYVQQGGALAIVGAQALSAESFREGTLAPHLPLVPANAPPNPGTLRVETTAVGALHPLTRDLAGAPLALAGSAPIDSVAPDAMVLLENVGEVAGSRAAGPRAPLLAVRRVGAGRVLMLATDSMWRVGFPSLAEGGDPERLAVFWDRVLAWMAGEAGGALALEVEGREVRVSGGTRGEELELSLEDRAGGRVSRRVTLDEAGTARITAEAELVSARLRSRSSGEDRVAFASGPTDADERAGVSRTDAVLRALVARCGGGIDERGDDLPPAPRAERARLIAQTHRPVLAALLALLGLVMLGSEWIVRRGRGAR